MKKLGIGYENYKEFIEQDLYYVDKTILIRDILVAQMYCKYQKIY